MTAPMTTQGNSRPYQYRPSADKLGNAPYVHGPLKPMETPRGLFARLMGRG